MTTIRKLILASAVLAVMPWSTAQAGGFIGISVGVPIGGYYRPYPYYYGYGPYYYRPYPAVYVGPPAVVVGSPVVETVPVQPAYAAPAPAAPAVAAAPSDPAPALTPVPANTTVIRASTGEPRQTEIDNCLAHLGNPDERVRADMAIQLGRLHAVRAVDTLDATLLRDPSPSVRDSAARALGLIGSRAALTSLERAAKDDGNPDVRRSAEYSAEVIRHGR
jgi:hypothetical protein